ncbi:MAG TPA: hypothetical protein VFQ53_43420 [Kofleriaceae bacterium]|nr:hypothetical protein [Kofleriaceae bacterium]
MIARQLGVLALVAACGGGKSDDKKQPESKPTESGSDEPVVLPKDPAPDLEKLTVTLDGKPLAMQRAFIKRVSPDHWRVQIGDAVGSCDELLSGVTNAKPGATFFVITLAKRLHPYGSDVIAITDFTSGKEPILSAYDQPVKLTGSTDKDGRAVIELPAIADVIGKKTFAMQGALTATGCGDQPDTGAGVPKASHVSAATLTIAGKSLELHGAILRGSDVVLSTGPKDCSPVTPFAQVIVSVRGGRWELAGTWIPKPITASDGMKDVKFRVGASGTSADGPTAALELSGSGTLGGYPLVFSGKLEALDCPTK